MNIYTGYFANLRKVPSNIVRIAICGKSPDWYDGIEYKKLAPKYKFFMEWKNNHDNNYYIEHFNSEILDKLDPNKVYKELESLSNGKDCVLLCYEKSQDFCHRHLVANWLSKSLLIDVKEWQLY